MKIRAVHMSCTVFHLEYDRAALNQTESSHAQADAIVSCEEIYFKRHPRVPVKIARSIQIQGLIKAAGRATFRRYNVCEGLHFIQKYHLRSYSTTFSMGPVVRRQIRKPSLSTILIRFIVLWLPHIATSFAWSFFVGRLALNLILDTSAK